MSAETEMISATEMVTHIADLCSEHGIEVTAHSSGGRAWRQIRKVSIKPVRSAVTYAVALHEIGHILGPDQNKPSLFKEAGAWMWATQNALEWSPQMRAKAAKCLDSYARHAIRKHKRGVCNAPTLPPAGHAFWTMCTVEAP